MAALSVAHLLCHAALVYEISCGLSCVQLGQNPIPCRFAGG